MLKTIKNSLELNWLKRWLNSYAPAVLWGLAMAAATLMPGSQLPESPDWSISVDKLGHFVLFATWSILLLFAYSHKNPQYTLKNLLLIVTFGVFYGLLLETGQLWVPGREFSWPDIAANSSGSFLGALGFWTMGKSNSKLV